MCTKATRDYISVLIQSCREVVDYSADFISNQNGVYYGDIEVEFKTSENNSKISLSYTSNSGSIMDSEDEIEIIFESDSGTSHITYDNVLSDRDKEYIQTITDGFRQYKYCMDAVKWYKREKAIEKISEMLSSGQIEFSEQSRELYDEDGFVESFGEADYVVYQAEYGDAVYTYSYLDDYEIIDEILDLYEEDYAFKCIYDKVAPKLKIDVGNYYTHTIFGLSDRERKALSGLDANLIEVEDVMVRTSMARCYNKDHVIERIRASIRIYNSKSLRIETVQINAYYCATCNRYYILEEDYEDLKERGTVCCRVVELKDLENLNHPGWAEKSILRLYGYSVAQKDNLSEKERRNILDFIIYNDIWDKERCIDFISWLVSNNSNRANMDLAIRKWNSDIMYLRQGHRPPAKNFIIGTIFQ